MAPGWDWLSKALCDYRIGPDAWYPEGWSEEVIKPAAQICRSCPVQDECRSAGTFETWGIWAGELHTEGSAKKVEPEMVSAFGAMRRVQSLAALGWNGKDISADVRRYAGILLSPRRLDQLRAGEESELPEEVFAAIHRSFKRLGRMLNSGNSATNAITLANLNGWKTPREWRGYDIDDPEDWPDDWPDA